MREHRGSLVATAAAKVARTESRLVALRLRRRMHHRRVGLDAVPPPAATIDVDPATVTHRVPFSRFDESLPRALLGTVRGDDWDRDPISIEQHPKYRACRARVEDGIPWAETGIVDYLAAELESVPVQVLCRHADWQAVRETAAAADTADALPADVPPDHPDLREFDL